MANGTMTFAFLLLDMPSFPGAERAETGQSP